MRRPEFMLDARLQADTVPVASLEMCNVLLMNDARYPWLILVPRETGLVEISDLGDQAQQRLWREVNRAAKALREIAPCDKINIGALGNIVRQLHVHVVARREGDAAWPGPVWGNGRAEPYSGDALQSLLLLLRQQFSSTTE
ncbi:HIT domain-containing protein [Dyella psychrodurans]|uniref:HIT family protein n=1 Tax=Dyella psychrodurans TaxID=1927960 RepID=A0A370XBQ0_9GAMM|nr:HIT family protein [Dyella psychrodurans]RDS85732.1 HIT family protein [Dyella psychrodurans]